MSRSQLGRDMLIVAGVLIGATLVAAVMVMDSPGQKREQRLDARRVEDLRQIEVMMDAWASTHQQLPGSLSDLADQPGISLPTTDPVSGAPYDYEPTTKTAYRLCAVFSTDSARTRRNQFAYAGSTEWAHPAGRHCFERSVKLSEAKAAEAAAAVVE